MSELQIIIPTEQKVSQELTKQAITDSKAAVIKSAFDPMVKMLEEFESEFERISNLPITPETSLEARELRLKMVKVRTGADKVHKEQKEEYLKAGRAIDGVRNILKWAVEDKEAKLDAIENHFVNIEKEQKMKLFNERLEILKSYVSVQEAQLIPLADLHEDTFKNMVTGYEAAKQARLKAEQEQTQRLKEEKEAREAEEKRIREENERLKVERQIWADIVNLLVNIGFKWNEELKRYQNIEINSSFGVDEIKGFKSVDDFKVNPFYHASKTAFEKQQLKLEKERQKKANDERKKKEDQLAERRLKRAPDKQKLISFVNQIDLLQCLPLKDEEAQKIFNNAIAKLSDVKKYVLEKAEEL